jgi:glycosyltransferase involved in cell wall biosynthesis
MAYGGIETALLNWLRTMDQTRFAISLFCFANPSGTEEPFIQAGAAAGFAVKTIPWSRRKPILRSARLLAEHLRSEKIEILHCHNTYADIVGLLGARLAGVKTVNTLYVWGRFGFVRNTLQWIDSKLLPYFDQVTAHCEKTLEGTIQRGYPATRLKLLTCGFDAKPVTMAEEERIERRTEMGATESNFVLIHVARFWPEKAHDFLLEAFRDVVKLRPQAQLWLLGVGPLFGQVQRLVEEMGLTESVKFLGFRSDLEEIIALADLQIHPSDDEGVPLAICAGMAAGMPIVATQVGGLGEVIRHDVSGVLVEKRQKEQLVRAVVELMDQPDRRALLGRQAARFIEEEYSLRSATARVERVYEELVTA